MLLFFLICAVMPKEADPAVVEVSTLQSRFGFMAIHGGGLEQMTDVPIIAEVMHGETEIDVDGLELG